MTILVTGASGTLGRPVVRSALDAGLPVRALSRRERTMPAGVQWITGDLGTGLTEALEGVRAIVHCATQFTGNRDVAATRNLIEAARETGGAHLVYISIVGIESVPQPYYRTKLAVEELVTGSGLPWTILRATQFHDLIHGVLRQAAKLPLMPVPGGMSFQPVEVSEVAARLVQLATGPPAGRVPDFGGPEVLTTRQLADTYLRVTGRHRVLVPLALPGRMVTGYRAGGHLAPDHPDGTTTFASYLARRTP